MAINEAARRPAPNRVWGRPAPAFGLTVLCVLLATACSPSERAEQAREVASRFLQAAGGNDPTTACGLLAPRTAEDLPEDCAQALEDWPGPTEITEVAVWGDRAQAKSGDSALFLAEFNDGWRVVAAGCVPRGENLPYQCTVGGA